MFKRHLLLALAGLFAMLPLAAPAGAESMRLRPKAVVELFTSQGCAQCPPADAMLTSLAEHDDVVALAYHVDYWDYAGWEDTFGSEENSDRQRAYAESWGSSRIFTPQMVVNGTKGVVGSKRHEVHGALDHAALPLTFTMARDKDMLKINLPANPRLDNAVVWLVTYKDRADIAIGKGENAGKSMVYTQVVTGRRALGMWESTTGASIKLPLSEILDGGNTGLAILVQEDHGGLPGPILGAAAFEQ
jgi:hypothetical protein